MTKEKFYCPKCKIMVSSISRHNRRKRCEAREMRRLEERAGERISRANRGAHRRGEDKAEKKR